MIPTAILLGLVTGLSRYRWWSIPLIGIIWVAILIVSGDPSVPIAQLVVGGFLIGALNGAAGVLVSWGLAHALKELFAWGHQRWSTR
jgi:hypothetical protein